MTEHLGYEKHDTAGKQTANSRNGVRPKTVLTETTGPVEVDVPRGRQGTFEPVIVARSLNSCQRPDVGDDFRQASVADQEEAVLHRGS